MKNFIKVTNIDGFLLYINYHLIENIHWVDSEQCTILVTVGPGTNCYAVKESPEAILALIDNLTN